MDASDWALLGFLLGATIGSASLTGLLVASYSDRVFTSDGYVLTGNGRVDPFAGLTVLKPVALFAAVCALSVPAGLFMVAIALGEVPIVVVLFPGAVFGFVFLMWRHMARLRLGARNET